MFEKEAEEYVKANNLEWELECHRTSPIGEVNQAFQNGAEFGYNKAMNEIGNRIESAHREGVAFGKDKANEWHYVKDGDLPKDEDWKWCISYRGYCYVAKYEEMFGCWTNQEYSEVMQPYAWKEIVLPKESE